MISAIAPSTSNNRHTKVAREEIMKRLCLIAVALSGVALVGCSRQSPVEPAGAAAAPSELSARAAAAPGTYDLFFLNRGQPVESLVVGQEVTLKAHVTSSAGPVTSGTAIFQYCSRPGPKNDITRADEAPKAECEAGTARWTTLVSVGLNQFGDAYGGFGVVRIPRTIGFRYQFSL